MRENYYPPVYDDRGMIFNNNEQQSELYNRLQDQTRNMGVTATRKREDFVTYKTCSWILFCIFAIFSFILVLFFFVKYTELRLADKNIPDTTIYNDEAIKISYLVNNHLCVEPKEECGLHVWNNTMYFFAKPTAKKLTWFQARGFCKSLNMHLIRIETYEENDAIKDIIVKHYNGKYYYMDGTDEDSERRWIWKETGERIRRFDWYVNQPQNRNGENYLCMIKHEGIYAWHDVPNDWLIGGSLALCEKPIKTKN